ncbi:MAG: UDP-N-acetylmuramyl pentapeptide synthase [Actinobacteria bacterium]|nr:UDP-N-acetylmuramyl pentapeptide synthase [Actinomycetota bacterium]
MIKISAGEFAKIVNGQLRNLAEDFVIDQLPVINSKLAKKGTFFIAFKGKNVDGHEYVAESIKSGSEFALVSKELNEPTVLVKDTGEALLALARYVRNKITGLKVVGITGSQGKTTTKELLHSILKSEGQTVATEGNFNTEIGVPLTILNCNENTKYCIIEMGARHQGDIPNALAAAAAAHALEISNESIATGLTVAKLGSKWRMQVEELNGLQIINDFYNANPESMKAAIKTLILLTQESGGSSWAILGKMHELGQIETSSHLSIVEYCENVGVDHLISVGTDLYQVNSKETKDRNLVLHQCKNVEAVLELVDSFSVGDVILLKASRSERFEDLAQAIKGKWIGAQQ